MIDIILLCAGLGSRIKNNIFNKPLNYINGKHQLEYMKNNFDSDKHRLFFIYNKQFNQQFEQMVKHIFKKDNFQLYFYDVQYLTRGPVETVSIFLQQKNTQEMMQNNQIIVMDCDIYIDGKYDFKQINDNHIYYSIDDTNYDRYSFITFDTSFQGNNHGLVSTSELNRRFSETEIDQNTDQNINYMTDIAEKQKISDNYCIGIYGFKNSQEFLNLSRQVINNNKKVQNEYYISQLYKELIQQGKKIICLYQPVISIGTTEQIIQNDKYFQQQLRICFDLDGTLVTSPQIKDDYRTCLPIQQNIDLLKYLKQRGHIIIIFTSRRMLTCNHNVGQQIAQIGKITFDQLDQLGIPYDEILFGKPIADIYIDDRSLNPLMNNIQQFGFNIDIEQNKILNFNGCNIYNNLQLIDNNGKQTIIKKGQEWQMLPQFKFYMEIQSKDKYESIRKYFPCVYNGNNTQYEMEYLKGITFNKLYKNKQITINHIDRLIGILQDIHQQKGEIIINQQQIKDNYLLKMDQRYSDKKTYGKEYDEIYQQIRNQLQQIETVDIVHVVHGDFWFSNIMLLYDDQIKIFDPRGSVMDIYTTNGDRYYDYAKLYQSIIGFDLFLEDMYLQDQYYIDIREYFEKYVQGLGLDISVIKCYCRCLLLGSVPFYEKIKNDSKRFTDFLNSI